MQRVVFCVARVAMVNGIINSMAKYCVMAWHRNISKYRRVISGKAHVAWLLAVASGVALSCEYGVKAIVMLAKWRV
jgi:ABC-type enterobactin transport system permease subunit